MLAAHLSADDMERRYRSTKQVVERMWWQIVWLVSQGQTATAAAVEAVMSTAGALGRAHTRA